MGNETESEYLLKIPMRCREMKNIISVDFEATSVRRMERDIRSVVYALEATL